MALLLQSADVTKSRQHEATDQLKRESNEPPADLSPTAAAEQDSTIRQDQDQATVGAQEKGIFGKVRP